MQSSSPSRPRSAASPARCVCRAEQERTRACMAVLSARDSKALTTASSQLNTSGIDGESYSEAVKRLNAQSAQLQKKVMRASSLFLLPSQYPDAPLLQLQETNQKNSMLEKHISRLESDGRADAVDFSSLRQSQKTSQVRLLHQYPLRQSMHGPPGLLRS